MISGKAIIAGVMGWPISHSRSPYIHEFWLQKYRIDGTYIPMPVDPTRLEQALKALPVLGFRGCNLTIPHKEAAKDIVDKTDALAQRVGAINTVVVDKNGHLIGSNTDVLGFSENLKSAGFSTGKTATVLGAGGAARAIIVALEDMGFQEIRIVNRTKERAENYANGKGKKSPVKVYGWSETKKALEGADLLVNTTSLGMEGRPPLEIDLSPLPKTAWVTDIVYAPLMTNLLRQAQNKGHQTVDGLGMLLHQARPGFAAWFGADPEVTDDLRQFVLAGK